MLADYIKEHPDFKVTGVTFSNGHPGRATHIEINNHYTVQWDSICTPLFCKKTDTIEDDADYFKWVKSYILRRIDTHPPLECDDKGPTLCTVEGLPVYQGSRLYIRNTDLHFTVFEFDEAEDMLVDSTLKGTYPINQVTWSLPNNKSVTSIEDRITALEQKFKQYPQQIVGTTLTRCLMKEGGIGWCLGVGGMQQPKSFFYGKTMDDVVSQAERETNTDIMSVEQSIALHMTSFYDRVGERS